MKNRFYTVLILRHASSRFRRFHVSYPFVASAVAIAVLVAAAGLVAPHLIVRLQGQSVELSRLEQENIRLQEERETFEGAMTRMAVQLETFEQQAQRLAAELGVEGLPSTEPAAGGDADGSPRRFWFEHEVGALRSRTEDLDRSLDQLGGAFKERQQLLASTPATMPIDGWFSHGYGWRKDPFTGKREFHRGVDIVNRAGTPVMATAGGVIERAGRFGAYGNCVDIDHGYGYTTRYAHLSNVGVRVGDRVERGQSVGTVGSTGRSTGPHLHYEVFRDGRRVNPWKYLGR